MDKVGEEIYQEKIAEARISLEGSRKYLEWYNGFSFNQFQIVLERSKFSSDQFLTNRTGKNERRTKFWFRSLVRTILFHIEGICYCMRQIVLWGHERGEIELLPEMYAILNEKRYFWRNSEVRFSHEYLDLKGSIEVSFNSYARLYGVDFSVDFSGIGWESLALVESVRNRMTHPQKLPDDYSMTPTMETPVKTASMWFMGLRTRLDLDCGFVYNGDRDGHKKMIIDMEKRCVAANALPKEVSNFVDEERFQETGMLKAFRRLKSAHELLLSDTMEARKELDEKITAMKVLIEDPSWSLDTDGGRWFQLEVEIHIYFRLVVQALFSEIDGICHLMRSVIINAHREERVDLSLGELVLVREERYYLRSGVVRSADSFGSALTNLELAFNLLHRVINSGRSIDRSSHE